MIIMMYTKAYKNGTEYWYKSVSVFTVNENLQSAHYEAARIISCFVLFLSDICVCSSKNRLPVQLFDKMHLKVQIIKS